MAWGAVAGAVIGGLMADDGSGGASGASLAATKEANALQRYQYDTTRRDQAPYRGIGVNALARLGLGMGMSEQELAQAFGTDVKAEPDAMLGETEASIRQRLTPQFSSGGGVAFISGGGESGGDGQVGVTEPTIDQAGLDKAVQAEMSRIATLRQAQQDILTAQQVGKGTSTVGAPGGELMRNFTMADYQADPGYAFRLSEGQKGLERSAAARGGLYSGRAMKDMTRFGQDQASNEYQNAYSRFKSNQTDQYNRLANLAGIGQVANNALATAGSNYANTAGNNLMINGANQGNAALASGAARMSTYQGIGNALGRAWGNSNTTSTSNPYAGGSDQWTGNSPYAWD